ncbi:MAG: hypothetical protein E3J90_08865 [Promethearchaeota archaeon]|nr:MAG: hypothetical protein E3J90_08865 [Candidatus Lokiarchaeota archaeon]
MIGYLDSELFYLVFLGWLIGFCILNIVILSLRQKDRKVSKWLIVNRFILVVSITVLILDSIPYLFIDIFDVPVVNIILSNIFLLLLAVSSIIYEYITIKENTSSRKNLATKKEGNL